MAIRYHFKKNSDPGLCKAQPGKCPLGAGEDRHFNTKEEAYRQYERDMIGLIFPEKSK